MIIVRLFGGLGNQLFQYAAGLRLAHKRSTSLKLDLRAFKDYRLFKYSLGNFKILVETATDEDFSKIGKFWTSRFAVRFAKTLKLFRFGNLITEKTLNFEPEVLDLPDNVYLSGYWESEKYFEDIKDIIRREFVPREELSDSNKEFAKKIAATNSVSIHIRRGDRMVDPVANKIHGIISLKYYENAIKIFEDKFKDAHFYIFSDDPEWAKKNLNLSWPHTYVEGNTTEKGYLDLHLMSLCKHNIIPNSTFSWWAAWLNSNPGKIVVAPKKWFRDRSVKKEDRYPAEWIVI